VCTCVTGFGNANPPAYAQEFIGNVKPRSVDGDYLNGIRSSVNWRYAQGEFALRRPVKNSTHSVQPFRAASCSGVSLACDSANMFAPCFCNIRRLSSLPLLAARCAAVSKHIDDVEVYPRRRLARPGRRVTDVRRDDQSRCAL
jgi:hypothetical protein